MIKCSLKKGKGSCDNCSREMTPILHYEFYDYFKEYVQKYIKYSEICLCEDCAAALFNLHKRVMENGEAFKYENDDFEKVITNESNQG